jgi:TRAP-type transport system periplasmic protein
MLAVAAATAVLAAAADVAAQTTLKLVTQVVATSNDPRKDLPAKIADGLAAANAGLTIKSYFDSELLTAAEMYRGVREGTVDIALVFLPTSARDVPEIGIHGMPGVLMRRSDAKLFAQSPAQKQLADVLETKGVLLMEGYWDALFIGTTGECIRRPANLDGVIARGPGRPFEAVLEAKGAIPVPFAGPEIPRALKTGAIDLLITSTTAIALGDAYKYMKCMTDPDAGSPGMVHTSFLVNKASFEKLNPQQQAALRAALTKGREWIDVELPKYVSAAIERFRASGVKIIKLEDADLTEWQKSAEAIAFRDYNAASPQAAQILKSAMQAMNRN